MPQPSFIEDEEVVTPEDYRGFFEAGDADDDYEWLRLWQIPLYLHSRKQYYREALERIRQRIEDAWTRWQDRGGSRERFESSTTVRGIWDRGMPPWWGHHDVVGWIDIQLDIREWRIFAALFLPAKRISLRLKDKTLILMKRLFIPLGEEVLNEDLRERVIEAVQDAEAVEAELEGLEEL